MREEEKSKIKYNVIICFICTMISLIFIILELLIMKRNSIFWIIIFISNLLILLGNYYAYKKM